MYDNDEIPKIVPILQAGGLLVFPTDTIWGIGCNACDAEAVQRIYELKKRAGDKPMPLLIDTYERLITYVEQIDPKATALIDYHDRPLTIIYKKAKNLPLNAIAPDGSIAIRVVKDDFCKALIAALGCPIIATSANFSGASTPQNFSEIDAEFLKQVDYIAQHRREEMELNEPSTIVKIAKNGDLTFIRK